MADQDAQVSSFDFQPRDKFELLPKEILVINSMEYSMSTPLRAPMLAPLPPIPCSALP